MFNVIETFRERAKQCKNTKKFSAYRVFDRAGAFLPERAGWLVVPIGRSRDSGPLDLSNWEALESELESKAGEEGRK